MIWTVLTGALLLAWVAVCLTAFCPVRALRQRRRAREAGKWDEDENY